MDDAGVVAAVEELAERGAGLFPGFGGQALYSLCSVLPLSGQGDGCEVGNCEVLLEGPGLEVTLVATKDIAPGEGLVLCDGEDGEEDEDEDEVEEEEEEEEEGGPPAKRSRR